MSVVCHFSIEEPLASDRITDVCCKSSVSSTISWNGGKVPLNNTEHCRQLITQWFMIANGLLIMYFGYECFWCGAWSPGGLQFVWSIHLWIKGIFKKKYVKYSKFQSVLSLKLCLLSSSLGLCAVYPMPASNFVLHNRRSKSAIIIASNALPVLSMTCSKLQDVNPSRGATSQV